MSTNHFFGVIFDSLNNEVSNSNFFYLFFNGGIIDHFTKTICNCACRETFLLLFYNGQLRLSLIEITADHNCLYKGKGFMDVGGADDQSAIVN